jgi:hypothetical protein
VQFFDAWLELTVVDLVRVALPLVLALLPVLVPGPRVTWLCSAAMAPVTALAMLGRSPTWVAAGWGLLWLALAFRLRRTGGRGTAPAASGAEPGLVGMGLGLALLAFLVAGIARQDLSESATRLTSSGVALLASGLLHLMLRRHAIRAAFGVLAMAFGLQLLQLAANAYEIPGTAPGHGGVLLGAALAGALVIRVGESRARFAGGPWVGDAHMLHD